MSIRATARQWFARTHPSKGGKILTSRFYPPKDSWTGTDAWWITIPLTAVEQEGEVHLVCEQPGTAGFRYLRVPTAFLRRHLNGFSLLHDTRINLFLSAERKDEFTDRRGPGRLSFAQFEQ